MILLAVLLAMASFCGTAHANAESFPILGGPGGLGGLFGGGTAGNVVRVRNNTFVRSGPAYSNSYSLVSAAMLAAFVSHHGDPEDPGLAHGVPS